MVKDTGSGIDPQALPKLFTPFVQEDNSTARKFGGTGLGLNISKQLVELMGGHINLTSKLGEGTTVSFHVPLRLPEANSTGQSTEPVSGKLSTIHDVDIVVDSIITVKSSPTIEKDAMAYSEAEIKHTDVPPLPKSLSTSSENQDDQAATKTASRGHILIVEDNAVNRMVALKMIKKLGYTSSVAWNGAEALTYLSDVSSAAKNANKMPDLILMDCQMPVMDGFEATLRLRGLEDKNSDVGEPDEWHSLSFSQAIRNIPIVAVTASAIKGDKERCREVGMNDWLTKPLAFGSLQRMLDKWIETEIVSKDPS